MLTATSLKKLGKNTDTRSASGSVISAVSNKTAGGNIKKHCIPCKKLVSNWSKHKAHMHGGCEVESVKCTGD